MRFLLCLLLLVTAKATSVQYLEGEKISHALDDESLTYVTFPESCELDCRAEFVFQAKAETTVTILQDAFYVQRLVVAAEGAEMQTTSDIDLDVETLTLFTRTQRITVPSGRLVSLTVLCTTLEGRFAVLVGERSYDFWQSTVGFASLVQSARMWAQRFYFPFIYGILCLLFFLSWPLQKRRPNTTMILTSLAMLSLFAWTVESFYSYFLIASVTKQRSFLSFLLHVLVNLIFVLVLSLTMDEAFETRRIATVTVAICSLLIGGGGAYLCPVLLLLELLFLRERRGKMNSVVCKMV
jgi:hypothetical protein